LSANACIAVSAATKTSVKNFAAALTAMHALADNVRQESDRLEGLVGESAHELRFAGETNLKNLAAVKNLMSMGREHLYVNAGLKIDIASALPGIKCWILGPPTLKQSEAIRKEARSNPDEFWFGATSFWVRAANAHPGTKALFRSSDVSFGPSYPLEARWFVQRAAVTRTDELLSLVRVLDKAMNNTSVIMLLE